MQRFTYHVVNIKQKQKSVFISETLKFTYHVVNIKLAITSKNR